MQPLRFGVIGLGVNGSKHVSLLSEIPGAQLTAVCDIIDERWQPVSQRYGITGYHDYHQLLAREDIDIINICTPSGLHGDMAIAAAEAGKHAIVEKPMDVSLEKADAMIHAFRRAERKLCVISQHRFDPATVALKAAIDRGELGDLLLAEVTCNWYRSQAYYDEADWRGTWALDGGGALMNQSIHTIDVFQYLAGPVASVYSQTDRLGHVGIEVEDTAIAIWRLAGGGMASVVGTTVAYPGLPTQIALYGTKATAVLTGKTLTHWYRRPEGESGLRARDKHAVNLAQASAVDADGASDPAQFTVQAHRLEIEDMMQAVRENQSPKVTGEEGRKPLALILGMYESARTGRPTVISEG